MAIRLNFSECNIFKYFSKYRNWKYVNELWISTFKGGATYWSL